MESTLRAVYASMGGLDQAMHQRHRDQTGSFYTPFEVASETVLIAAVRRLCCVFSADPDEVRRCLEKPGSDPQRSEQYFEAMHTWHVVDPAGGDGVFAIAWLSLLETLCRSLEKDPQLLAKAAERVHLFDLQPEPVAHYKDMVASYFKLDREKLGSYTGNVLDTASLLQGPPVAEVLALGGYDLVVGNPPYIGEKNHKDLFDEAKRYPFGAAHYEKNMDFFYYFIHLGMALLAEGGILGFITTGYFFTADGASGLRTAMSQNGSFVDLARFEGGSLFKDAAGQSNVIFHYRRGVQERCRYVEVPAKPKTLDVTERWRQSSSMIWLNRSQIVSRFGNFYFSMHPGEPLAIEEMEAACSKTFGDVFQVRQGIVSGFDRAPDEGVFVLTPEEALSLEIEEALLVPFYKNSQVKRGKVDLEARFVLLYIPQEIEEFETHYPNAYRHLSRFRGKLSKRREVVNGVRPWYALQWPRTATLFEGPKIVAPHRALNNAFAYTDQPFYGSADLYYLTPLVGLEEVKPDKQISNSGLSQEDLLAVSLILITEVYEFWLSVRGKRKGDVLELYATPLRQMPLPPLEGCDASYLRLKTLAVDHYRRFGHLCNEDLRAEASGVVFDWLGLSEVARNTIKDYFEAKRT
ncbi:Eco57I restriction-modification methylase domain-containing protein [Acidaminobacter sp.]|uniref:Eco57I restriction-modification methylase domain-containing protein n=1 Tax=Acidaminobacter sp. TaxID=1872102 RepID=UPI002562DE92|nr:Eco57I restriction-modification methylase domain-containing protein [Acidaminobacter sp.]MDK9709752.1 Eco57I restriction-modification methylase domain-containing protein [Acidaminobacter sp.]